MSDVTFVTLRASLGKLRSDLATARQLANESIKDQTINLKIDQAGLKQQGKQVASEIEKSVNPIKLKFNSDALNRLTQKPLSFNAKIATPPPPRINAIRPSVTLNADQVDRSVAAIRAKLRTLEMQGLRLQARANTSDATAKLSALINQVRSVNGQTVNIKGRADLNSVHRQIDAIKAEIHEVNKMHVTPRGGGGGYFSGAGGRFLGGSAAASFLGAGSVGAAGAGIGAVLGGPVGAIAGGVGGVAAGATAGFVADGVSSLGQTQKIEATLQAIAKNDANGTKLLEEVRKLRESAPQLSRQGIESASVGLAGAGFDLDKIPEMIRSIAGASAVSTAPMAEAMERAVRAISQIKTNNALYGEELNQLTEIGIPARRILSEQFGGMSSKEIAEKSQSGEIEVDEILTKLLAGFQDAFGGSLEKQLETLPGQIDVFNAKLTELKETIAEPMIEPLTEALTRLNQAVDAGALDGIVGALEDVTAASAQFVIAMGYAADTYRNWGDSDNARGMGGAGDIAKYREELKRSGMDAPIEVEQNREIEAVVDDRTQNYLRSIQARSNAGKEVSEQERLDLQTFLDRGVYPQAIPESFRTANAGDQGAFADANMAEILAGGEAEVNFDIEPIEIETEGANSALDEFATAVVEATAAMDKPSPSKPEDAPEPIKPAASPPKQERNQYEELMGEITAPADALPEQSQQSQTPAATSQQPAKPLPPIDPNDKRTADERAFDESRAEEQLPKQAVAEERRQKAEELRQSGADPAQVKAAEYWADAEEWRAGQNERLTPSAEFTGEARDEERKRLVAAELDDIKERRLKNKFMLKDASEEEHEAIYESRLDDELTAFPMSASVAEEPDNLGSVEDNAQYYKDMESEFAASRPKGQPEAISPAAMNAESFELPPITIDAVDAAPSLDQIIDPQGFAVDRMMDGQQKQKDAAIAFDDNARKQAVIGASDQAIALRKRAGESEEPLQRSALSYAADAKEFEAEQAANLVLPEGLSDEQRTAETAKRTAENKKREADQLERNARSVARQPKEQQAANREAMEGIDAPAFPAAITSGEELFNAEQQAAKLRREATTEGKTAGQQVEAANTNAQADRVGEQLPGMLAGEIAKATKDESPQVQKMIDVMALRVKREDRDGKASFSVVPGGDGVRPKTMDGVAYSGAADLGRMVQGSIDNAQNDIARKSLTALEKIERGVKDQIKAIENMKPGPATFALVWAAVAMWQHAIG